MSTYVREKVLRIPYEKTGWQHRFEDVDAAREYCEQNFKSLFEYGKVGKFQFAPTESPFIDFVIEREYDASDGEWGKVRELYQTEFNIFARLFAQIMPAAEFSAIRVVEFCWYNCSEADDYYEYSEDPFYKEITYEYSVL